MTIETKTLKVIGKRTMHCGGCERAVKFALKQLSGVQSVEASYKTQRIDLTLDAEALEMARMHRELDWIDYQVVEVREA